VRLRLACRRERLEVLASGEVVVEAGLVDDRADAGERVAPSRGHRQAEQLHRAGRRLGQSEQHPDQGRLAGAVRAEVGERGPARHMESDVADDRRLAEALRQTFCLDASTV
jgi:hypothetical protein